MTHRIYMDSVEGQYVREFEAHVREAAGDHVVLDETAFYPEGGGQPDDRGRLVWEGGEAEVARVQGRGDVKHFVSGGTPPADTEVVGELDWDRRYRHMRMHTAQHLVSGIVYDVFGARTVGNQLHADASRIDFERDGFADDELEEIEDRVADVVDRAIDLEVSTHSRDDVEAMVDPDRVRLDLIPKSVRELRVVEIGDVDVCPCAGTHVRSTGEIGGIRFTKTRSKGAERTRLVYELVD